MTYSMKAHPSVLEAVARDLVATRWFPESTYRVPLHAGFTFRDALHIMPYLHALGITHCYASPFLQARPGSTHGSDILSNWRGGISGPTLAGRSAGVDALSGGFAGGRRKGGDAA